MKPRSSLIVLALLALLSTARAKVYTRCELVDQLRAYGSNMVATWTCIASYESNYNSAFVSGPLPDGSFIHGIWKIDDNNWCYNPNHTISAEENRCQIGCEFLRTDDLDDAWACATQIQQSWTFFYWPSWVFYCNTAEDEPEWTDGC